MELWNFLAELKAPPYHWVDLSYEVSPSTPHYEGFNDLQIKDVLTFAEHKVCSREYNMVSQYGTHVDPPFHFVEGARSLERISIKEMVCPLCVVDASAKAEANPDYALSADDLMAWEKTFGQIPEGAFVAMRTDWHKRAGAAFLNTDAAGDCHYPGWGLDALKFLCEKRKITAIGHELPDTDPAITTKTALWAGELYFLKQDKYQIELLLNLDQVPPVGALIFSAFPAIKDAPGFTVRCFAVCPNA
jgi:kynurenine formamidase